MVDVFISYSRRDKEFVRRLHHSLIQTGLDVWADWEDIPPSADWMEEIREGIEAANFFVFVISPDSMASKVCFTEVEYGVAHNKRLVPILYRDVEPPRRSSQGQRSTFNALDRAYSALGVDSNVEQLYDRISPHNWIFMRETDDYDAGIATLLKTMETDLEHVREHTRLLVKAKEWNEHDQEESYLIKGSELEKAEDWLTNSAGKKPAATELHLAFISSSRQAENRQQQQQFALERRSARRLRWLVGVLASAAILALVLLFFIAQESDRAQQERDRARAAEQSALTAERQARAAQATADRRADEAESAFLGSSSEGALGRGDPFLALPLAVEGVGIENPVGAAQLALSNVAYHAGVRGQLHLETEGVTLAAYDADGSSAFFATSSGEIVQVNLATGNKTLTLAGHDASITDLALSSDGAILVSADSTGQVIVWDVASGVRRFALAGLEEAASSVDINPAGTVALASSCAARDGNDLCESGLLLVWSLVTGEELWRGEAHGGAMQAAAFSPQQDIIVSTGCEFSRRGSDDCLGSEVVLWDAEDGTLLIPVSMAPGTLSLGLSFRPGTDEFLTVESDSFVTLWEIVEARDGLSAEPFAGNFLDTRGGLTDLAFSPDGRRLLVSAEDTPLLLYDANNLLLVRAYEGHTGRVESVAVSPDSSRALSVTRSGHAIIWDIESGAVVRRLDTGRAASFGALTHLALSPDGKRALTGGNDGVLRVWDIDLTSPTVGQVLQTLPGQSGSVLAVALSPDGTQALSASGNVISLWDLAAGEVIRTLEGHEDTVNAVTFSPDGSRALSGCDDGVVLLWNLAEGTFRELGTHGEPVNAVTFGPAGRRAASASDSRTVLVWDLAPDAENPAIRLRSHSDAVTDVAFSPDGNWLLSASEDETVVVWNPRNGDIVQQLSGHEDAVRAVDFAPDGELAISASDDGTLLVWHVRRGEAIRVFSGHARQVLDVAFAPAGRFAYSVSYDDTLIIWRLDSLPHLIDWTFENRPVRELTCVERRIYRVEPLCDEEGIAPTRTPYPTVPAGG